jgi:hypothetical protein
MDLPANRASPRVLVVYHFFHPDDVVSARLFSDLAEGLHARGWDVTALTSDRTWAKPNATLPSRESWRGIQVERTHRPAWDQARPVERLANSLWMVGAWTARASRMGPFDAVIVGSDPAFAATLLVPLRRMWPRAAQVHWAYDLYPEAIVADGGGRATRLAASFAASLMRQAYRSCDAIVDLGPRMRERLEGYGGHAERITIAPWALAEPSGVPRAPDRAVREQRFGDCRLALLYSGTLGRAHDFQAFLDLARACRAREGGDGIVFCFASKGHRIEQLRAAISPADTNVRIAPMSDESALAAHLEAADIHLLSLREAWSGIVVPSKFFGSLAVGRPVLYAGSADSDVARLIDAHGVGMTLHPDDLGPTVQRLCDLAAAPGALQSLQMKARKTYESLFRKEAALDTWDDLLRRLTREPAKARAAKTTLPRYDRP